MPPTSIGWSSVGCSYSGSGSTGQLGNTTRMVSGHAVTVDNVVFTGQADAEAIVKLEGFDSPH